MRILLLAVVFLFVGCASVQDLTRASCLPDGVPGEVVLKRQAYLYKFKDEADISLWDSPYRYGSGVDTTGKMQMHSPPPLLVLPAGTRVTIQKISRETHFDNPRDVIHVQGVAHSGQDSFKFVYSWGIENRIHSAPWETDTYNPRDFSRTIQCGA